MSNTHLTGWAVLAFLCFTLQAGNEQDLPPRGPRASVATELFISEYMEGSSNNKALEFFNPSDTTIDLAAGSYLVEYYNNGSASVTLTINLTGTVASGETYVLAHGSALADILAKADQTDSNGWYNGDDAVVLKKGGAAGTILDVIGQVGLDPGSEWGTGDTSTANNTIRRKAAVCVGDTTSGDAFDPSTQWDGFAQDNHADLGLHTNDCVVRELFISEYVEGSSNNKALEFFNPTDASIDLAAGSYLVEYYFNGSSSVGTTINLTGTVASGARYVLANSSAVVGVTQNANQTAGGSWYNGDDAIVLKKGGAAGTVLDVIGQVGLDPGSQWGADLVSTADNTIRRKSTFCTGDTNSGDAFDPTTEWDGFAQDTYDGLGAHSADCYSSSNAAIAIDCDSPASGLAGEVLVHTVTASDADGTIDQFSISNIDPAPGAGTITLQNTATGEATVTADADVPAGTYVVTVDVANTDGTPQTAQCELTITLVGISTIAEIQGSGTASAFDGQLVATTGNLVTAVKADGFFMQAVAAGRDGDSSEGIFVYTGGAPSVVEGDEVKVVGTVDEYFNLTELTNVTVTVLSSGNALPTPILLDATRPSPNQPVSAIELERYEGMLVSFVNGLASSGNDNFGDVSVVASQNRPFREPGILYPGEAGLPVWDGNPEIFEIDPNGLAGMSEVEIMGGTPIAEATGPLTYSFGDYQILPKVLTLGTRRAGEGGNDGSRDKTIPALSAIPVRDRNDGEVTIASQNMLRLFDDINDGNGTTVSTAEYQRRLTKASIHFREIMKSPDIIAFQEVEKLEVLQALADKLHSDDGSLNYTPYLVEGNDVGGIDVGFLVRDTVSVTSVTQYGKDATYEFDGDTLTLHDRPPLVLVGTFNTSQPFPIQVMVVHNRSLNGIDGDDGDRIRAKRLAQAEDQANLIQTLQNGGMDHLVVVGDFNAFEFTDGYVDVVGVMTGDLDPAGALLPGTDLINPDLVNQVLNVPAANRYSYVFEGSAQVLDHVLTNQSIDPAVRELQYSRANSDFPTSYDDDETTALALSDHDGPVLFLEFPHITVSPTSGLTVNETGTTAGFTVVLETQPESNVTVSISSGDTGEISVSPSSLTFTSENWDQPQTVMLTGVADSTVDSDQLVTISVGPASSSDPDYQGLEAESVTATNQNMDVDVTVTPTSGLEVDESGSTDTFTVVLDVQPTANVTIPVVSGDTGEITVSPASLTFTTANWNQAQTVTLTGVADSVIDTDQLVTIGLGPATSSDGRYSGFNVDDVTAINVNMDVDVLVTPTSGLMVSESGTSTSFTVHLAAPPTANVTIPVSSGDLGEISVNPTSLTFTTANWKQAQTVTLTGVADHIIDGNQLVTISLGPASSSDPRYNGLEVDDVTATNQNIDSSSNFKLSANPGEHILIEGTANALVGLYYFNQETQTWIFIENVQLNGSGIGSSSILANPDTQYGVGGPDGTVAPVGGIWTVPTLGEWGLLAFALGLLFLGLKQMRQQRSI